MKKQQEPKVSKSSKALHTMGIIIIFIGIIMILIGLTDRENLGPVISGGIAFLLLGLFSTRLGKSSIKSEKKAIEQQKAQIERQQIIDNKVNELNKLEELRPQDILSTLTITNPNLHLNPGEICLCTGPAYGAKHKTVTVGSQSAGAGASVHVAKGLTIHQGGGSRQYIRKNILDTCPGTFYGTTQRMILTSEKYGFALDITKMISIDVLAADAFQINMPGRSFIVVSEEARYLISRLSLGIGAYLKVNTSTPDNHKKPHSSNHSDADKFDEIKQYKALLDDGIITEEEFDLKKKQLLGL
ncbi:MAG: SHOCT domain-containing protein [Eubacterium sp.]|nr:SHOCT domain-containing protein [Eubacterium sp.]MCH4045847.1 SHOCT domain-containing protein [Eubacterium sp.]MCH4078938.1 SHOCT domain-containing protein [Eubacterium sp.]